MSDKLLFGLALLLIVAGTMNIDTPWLSNTGSAAWLIRIGLVVVGLVLCLFSVAINRRKKKTNDDSQESA
jgi:hypothetical protein